MIEYLNLNEWNGAMSNHSLAIPTKIICLIMPIILFLSLSAFAGKSFQPVFKPTLDIFRATGKINVDGNLSDAGWQSAGRVENFVERNPGENSPPEAETRALITFDEYKLYVAFICFDNTADLRATMCQRDQFYGDDAICLLLDTYGDATRAYEFFVNPYGVQKDALWSAIGGEDFGFDLIWESAAQITDSGYQVEIAIPFSSLRFPNRNIQSWKMDFWRSRPRESFKQYSWAAYDRNEQCWPCQWGTVSGIANARPGKGVEFLPALVANQSGLKSDFANPESKFDNQDPDAELSLGGKYAVNSDITIEAAYNPDFSQIEADAAQIDVNTTIALFYPERRPFFQEGSDIFRTLFNSFYTRTVNDPKFAAKVAGRTARRSFALLVAEDENTPYIIPLDQASLLVNTGTSLVGVFRGAQTFGQNSRIGVMLSQRNFESDGSASAGALDFDIRLTRNYRIDGQYILTYTGEPDKPALTSNFAGMTIDRDTKTLALDGESYWGTAFISRLRRNARNWNWILDYNQVNPSYRTQVGFDPVVNYRNLSLYNIYNIFFADGILERLTPQLYLGRRWNFDDVRLNENLNFGANANLRMAQTSLGLFYQGSSETWRGRDFSGLWRLEGSINNRFGNMLGTGIFVHYGKALARRYMTTGTETGIDVELGFKPIDRLVIEPTLSYLASYHSETGIELYKGYISRTRFLFQATRELSLRLVVQYDDFDGWWDVDPLLTYRLSPFSVFYAGSSYDYIDFAENRDLPAKWRLGSRQYFMKLQYLFQF